MKNEIETKLGVLSMLFNKGEDLEETRAWVEYKAYKRYNKIVNKKFKIQLQKDRNASIARFVKHRRKGGCMSTILASQGLDEGITQLENKGALDMFNAVLDLWFRELKISFR